MSAFKSIKQGLTEAVAHAKGKQAGVKSNCLGMRLPRRKSGAASEVITLLIQRKAHANALRNHQLNP